jgi:tripartite-type tricarboxylate transporter receptor subunit TctC
MARVLGQSVVVTNRDGGSGVVGMRSVAASPADGHTLGLTPMTAIVVQPHLVRNLGIGPDSFAPVCGTNENVIGVVVRADSPVRDLPALVALGRERQLSFGSAGPNSLPQLAVWRVQRAAGNVDFTHVPYRGDPPHLNELLGGRLDFSSTVVASASELIDSGRLRLIAVFSRPPPGLPGRADRARAGPDAEQFSQVGIYAPRGTPEPVLDRLGGGVPRRAGRPGLPPRRREQPRGGELHAADDFARMVQDEFANYARILRDLGVKAE